AGLNFASSATQNGQAKSTREQWFGTTPAATLTQLLTGIANAMKTQIVGFCYQGLGLVGNPARRPPYNELAHRTNVLPVDIERQEWGWASPVEKKHIIGFGTKFFDEHTERQVLQAQTMDKGRPMEVSRGGAMLHELTHCYIKTLDHPMPDEA